MLGGSIAGVERDDEGNIIGFSPEKFALGFAAGAGGAKALSSNFFKKYAKIVNQKIKANLNFSLKNIVKNNKNFILQNPQGFIQELDKKSIRELLESKGNIQMSVGDGRQSLASEVANVLVSAASKISEKDKKVLQNFNKFVESSLTDSHFKGKFNFGAIKQENIKRLKKIKNDKGQITEFNLNGYTLKIDSNHIRHIKNSHPNDLDLLNNLYDIYHNFDTAQWNLTRDETTKKPIVAISFLKEYKDGIAKAVEVRIAENKTLNLKTLYRIEK